MVDIPINITVKRPAAGGIIEWSTSVMRDDSLQAINGISDKLMEAIQRQSIWGRIEAINDEIATEVGKKAIVLYNVRRFERGNPDRASSIERQGYEQNRDTLTRSDTLIAVLEEQQARLRKQLNGGGNGETR